LGGNLDANEEYDPATNHWSTRAPMPSKRGGIVGASLRERIYVFGGEALTGTFHNNEEYDPRTDGWAVRPSLPIARHGLAAVSLGNRIFVIGGGPSPGLSVSGVTEILTVDV
jgi:N-acetylneuraminic acid mutarotase